MPKNRVNFEERLCHSVVVGYKLSLYFRKVITKTVPCSQNKNFPRLNMLRLLYLRGQHWRLSRLLSLF